MSLLGPTPRSRPEVAKLPHVWAGLYAERRCGLLNDSVLTHDWSDPETGLAGDALACMQQGERAHMRRALAAYLKQVFAAILRGPDKRIVAPRAEQTAAGQKLG